LLNAAIVQLLLVELATRVARKIQFEVDTSWCRDWPEQFAATRCDFHHAIVEGVMDADPCESVTMYAWSAAEKRVDQRVVQADAL
jgi:hypothetical protein